jgi:hypothetical protein
MEKTLFTDTVFDVKEVRDAISQATWNLIMSSSVSNNVCL